MGNSFGKNMMVDTYINNVSYMVALVLVEVGLKEALADNMDFLWVILYIHTNYKIF